MILGLTGRMGAGKDTVAHRLAALLHPTTMVERRAFADRLKSSVATTFGIQVWQLEYAKNDPTAYVELSAPFGNIDGTRKLTVREYLQDYGVSMRKVFGDAFWLDQALPTSLSVPEHTLVVVTDCRFPNEAERVKNMGGLVFEVVGPQGQMDPGAAHVSERALPTHLLDGYIYNDKHDGFEYLHASIRNDLLSHPGMEGVTINDPPPVDPIVTYRCYRHYYTGTSPCPECA